MSNGKSILVLEGGAMRGLFTSGVIDVFLDNNISFDTTIGVSAGAAFGCNYKSKQKGRVLRYNLRFCNDKRYCSLTSLIKTGDLYGAKFCYDTLPNELDIFDNPTFRTNPMDFITVVTDVKTGLPYYYKCRDGEEKDLTYMRASASMPLVSRVVEIGGRGYLDGGIADPIPYKYAVEQAYEKIVVVLTRERGYRKENSKAMNSLISLLYRGEKKGISKAMKERATTYNATLDLLKDAEKEGKVFIIAPKESLNIGKREKDREKIKACYDKGIEVGNEILPALISYLNS